MNFFGLHGPVLFCISIAVMMKKKLKPLMKLAHNLSYVIKMLCNLSSRLFEVYQTYFIVLYKDSSDIT